MKLEGVELRRVALPLVSPFRTSFGVEQDRDVLLVRAVTDGAEGWGECVAAAEPRYSSEYADGAADVLRRFLVPAVAAAGDLDPEAPGAAMAFVKGHRMAKAALELAVLDAWLRARDEPLAGHLGATRDRVPAGVSVGIMGSVAELLDAVAGYLDQGYLRIKLKIEPGWDLEPVAAVRERFGDEVLLQVDANAAYTVADAGHLAGLDRFGLLLIEQPLAEDDLAGHAELAGRLATPVCLDESITSAKVAVDAVGPRRLPDRQRQGRPGRRLPGGQAPARRLPGAGRAPVVRRDAGDGDRPGRQRRPGRPARLHPARRHLGLRPLLPPGPDRRRSCSATATSRSRPAPGSGSSPSPRSWRS